MASFSNALFRISALVGIVAISGCAQFETTRAVQHQIPESSEDLMRLTTHFKKRVENVIYFDFDSDQLNGLADEIVAAQAEWIMKNPRIRFAVTGHTDRVGNFEYNMDLGMRRAESTVQALMELGVPEKQLLAMVSEGESQPVVNTELRELLNRRVVTEVYGLVPEERPDDRRLVTVVIEDENPGPGLAGVPPNSANN